MPFLPTDLPALFFFPFVRVTLRKPSSSALLLPIAPSLASHLDNARLLTRGPLRCSFPAVPLLPFQIPRICAKNPHMSLSSRPRACTSLPTMMRQAAERVFFGSSSHVWHSWQHALTLTPPSQKLHIRSGVSPSTFRSPGR